MKKPLMTLITVHTAADLLKVGERHIRRLCDKNILEAEKFGSQWFITEESVINYKKDKEKENEKTNEENQKTSV